MPSYTRADVERDPKLWREELERKKVAAEYRDRQEDLELQGQSNEIALEANRVAKRANLISWLALGISLLAIAASLIAAVVAIFL